VSSATAGEAGAGRTESRTRVTWRRWRPRNSYVVLLVGLLAALPAAIATGQAIWLGWTPSSDDGVIALRAFDVLSAHPPLLGQLTAASSLVGTPAYDLGSLLYVVLAVPAHIGAAALVLTMGAISVLAVILVVVLAHRRAGLGFMFLTAAAVVLMCRSLPVEVAYDVWNPWAGMFPFIALLFIAWSVACGDFTLLPLLILVVSYIVQCHTAYILPGIATVLVATLGLTLQRRRIGKPGTRHAADKARVLPWLLASVLIIVLCWAAPVIQQIRDRPGNLDLIARIAVSGHATLGMKAGLRSLARAVGILPLWAGRAPPLAARYFDLFQGPSGFAYVTAAILILGLVAALIASLSQRLHDVVFATLLALALCVTVVVEAGAIPAGTLALGASWYTLTWISPVGMYACLILGWSTWCLLAPASRLRPLRPSTGLVSGSCASLAILGLALIVADRPGDTASSLPPRSGSYHDIATATARVVDSIASHGGRVLLDIPSVDASTLTYRSSIAYGLRRRGIAFAVAPRLAEQLGDQYCPGRVAYPRVIVIAPGGARTRPGARVLVRSKDVMIELAGPFSPAHDRAEHAARGQDDTAFPSHCAKAG
jgi:hypothetical protein